jgi:hypothetical protein
MALTLKQKKELESFKKLYPIGIYKKEGFYTVKVVGYEINNGVANVRLQFTNSPVHGRSTFYQEKQYAKIFLKGYKLKK